MTTSTTQEYPVTTSHPVGALARITWARPGQPSTTSNAVRATTYTGAGVWATDRATVPDAIVTSIVPLIPIDLTDREGLGQLVDDSNRNGAGLTVHDLTYALRQHRAAQPAGEAPTRPVQRPASTSDAAKRLGKGGVR